MFFNFRVLAACAVLLSIQPAYAAHPFSSPRAPLLITSVRSKVREYIRQGNEYLRNGRYWGAKNYFSRALRIDPSNSEALYGRGIANLKEVNHIAAFGYSSAPGGNAVPSTVSYPTGGMIQEARVDLSRSKRMDGFAYVELGTALLHSGELHHSRKASEAAIRLGAPNVWRAYMNRGIILYQFVKANPAPPRGTKHFSEANTSLLKSIELNPKNWRAYKALGDMHEYAHNEFGYEQASLSLAQRYKRMAITLYNQTPEGRLEKAEFQRRKREQ